MRVPGVGAWLNLKAMSARRKFTGSCLAAAVVLGALCAVLFLLPWVYAGLRELGQQWGWRALATVGFGTVAERLLLVMVVPCGLWLLWRGGWRRGGDYGYGAGWAGAVPWGLALGVGVVALAVCGQIAVGARSVKAEWVWWAALAVLPGAVVVSLVEELVFRGVLLRLLRERMAFVWANVLQALVYAGMHFGSPPGFCSRHEARWSSGLEWLAACVGQFFDGALVERPGLWIKFAVLVALGWLMGVSVRVLGHVGWAVGFHAAVVWTLLTARQWTEAEKGWWRPWVGREPVESADVLLLAVALCAVQWVLWRRGKS